MSDREHSEDLVDLVGEDGRRIARWLTRPEAESKARELEEVTGEAVSVVGSSSRDVDRAAAAPNDRRQ